MAVSSLLSPLGKCKWPRRGRKLIQGRFLLDTDQEIEGLAVIGDFQGAALDDEKVLLEFKEIRDAVLADVNRVDFDGQKVC